MAESILFICHDPMGCACGKDRSWQPWQCNTISWASRSHDSALADLSISLHTVTLGCSKFLPVLEVGLKLLFILLKFREECM